MEFNHTSVLLRETVDSVVTNPKGIYVDCTLGGAGHAHAVGEMLDPEGMIIGLDQDEDALSVARQRLSDLKCQVLTIPTNFSNLKEALQTAGFYEVDGFIFDLGVSSYQLDTPERGFSYMNDGPLDMRMDKERGFSAYDVVNGYSFDELVRIFRDYGELKNASGIANKIINARNLGKITSAKELANIIGTAQIKGRGVSPAILAFQAIRIEVNGELDELTNLLDSIEKGGFKDCLVAIITFHSLEDRIVKERFKKWANSCICPPGIYRCECGNNHELGEILTKKPLTASQSELAQNSRSKSAKLRVFKIKG